MDHILYHCKHTYISLNSFLFYPITLAPNGMKESLAILKNCFPNGIPTIVMHQMQPTIRFPSAISQPKNIIHIRFTRNENMPFPYTISFPNGQNARVANVTCSHHLNLTILKWGLPARLPFKAKLKQAIPACPAVLFFMFIRLRIFSCAVRHILYKSFFLLLGC